MHDDARVRWWRVASHLIRPGLILASGAVPSAALLACMHWANLDVALAVLAVLSLVVTGGATIVGVALLLFAGCSVGIGRLQFAIHTRRALLERRSDTPPSPYR